MWSASTTVTSLLLLRRFNKSAAGLFNKSVSRAPLIHQTTFNSSSKFGGDGTFILHDQQAANSLHTTTTSSPSSFSSSRFGTIILQTNEPSDDLDCYYGDEIIIKMFMLSSGSDGDQEDKDDDDDDDDQKKKKKKKKKNVFKLDEDLGFSALYKDFNLQDSIRMVGSCNGIICLHDPEVRSPLRDVYLWNPATRQFKILPESTMNIEEKRTSYYKGDTLKDFVGFGLDVETKDYKVLRISPFVPDSYNGDGCRCRVEVYSLSTDSWRVLDGIHSLPLSPTQDLFGNRQGTYLNGSCIFLGTKHINHYGTRDLMLLSFDFTKEIFTFRELPDEKRTKTKLVLKYKSGQEFDVFKLDLKYWSKPEFDMYFTSKRYYDIRDDLRYLGDELAAFRTPLIDLAGGYVFTTPQIDLKGGYWYYDMWVLGEQNESGRAVVYKPKSWTRLHEFRIKTKSNHPYAEPRCVSNDREFALISTTSTTDNGRKKLMLFNLVTGKADFTIGDRDCRAAYVYKESQVSIMGGGNALLRWQLPTHGTTYKLNLDAPYIDFCCSVGIGLCLSSDTGGCIGVRSLKRHVSSAKEGEALAMLEAIKWAKELELSPIILESDSKNMVSFFNDEDSKNMVSVFKEEDDDDNNLLTWSSKRALEILEEAKLLLKSSENSSISFQYCSRSSNYVAEIASKLGSDNGPCFTCMDWTANFPGEVVMSLSKDLGLRKLIM